MTKAVYLVLIILVAGLFCAPSVSAQTTEISYQGSLKDSGLAANANYDIEFRLFSSLSGGSLIGTEIFLSPVPVVDGLFSVKLNFGPNFPGSDRYLEIAVRKTGVGSLVTLGPRQKISSVPYAIQSLQAAVATQSLVSSNALALGGINAALYIVTGDARLSDARAPLPGSGNYVQNTTTQQAGSNFNVSGTGTANLFNSTNGYNFGGNHLISGAGLDNLFAGTGSGLLNLGQNNAFFGSRSGFENKGGSFNAFFGAYAGQNNVTGNNNSFFGYFAGNGTTSGSDNSFFGNRAGQVNTSGAFNSFFGTFSGLFNSTGSDNSFFGNETGYSNANGNRNSFFGSKAGHDNSTGSDNAFLGSFAGRANTTGSSNSFVGSQAGQANASGVNNSFVGALAGFTNTASNNSFFGSEAGRFNTSGANNTFLGRRSGHDNSSGELNVFIGLNAGGGNTLGSYNTVIGSEADVLGNNLTYATAIGAQAVVSTNNTIVLGRPADQVRVPGGLNVTGTLTAGTLNLSATNLTGVVPTANGGTGLSMAGMAGRFLRSDGTNWQSLPFTAADVPQGSTFYVQNTTVQQGSTNFNISGNGTAGGTLSANAFSSATQYNIGGIRVLTAAGSNLFAGTTAGTANTTGGSNSFVGNGSGSLNSTGSGNSFFGSSAGGNSVSGANNTFAGASAGSGNSSGSNNSFFGVSAGQTNTIGSNNTVIGANANVGGNNLTFATAIGADAVVSTNNTIVLGRTLDTVRAPGNLQVDGNLIASNFSVNASNLTGTVAVANGGTGVNSSGALGNYLRSNGSIWQSSAIAASDLPAGNNNYIQNGVGAQSSSNFNISGNGTVGGVFTANSVSSSTQYNILGTRVLSNIGTSNIFVGAGTGVTGNDNSFFGVGAGAANSTGFSNTLVGSGANVGAGNLSFATALGAGATVGTNNSVVLGRAADTVRVPGSLVVTGAFSVPAANITGVLGTAFGGTGISNLGSTNGHFLKSNGTTWTTSLLLAADIPDLATSYIRNNGSVQGGATFNIGGNGTIGGTLTVGGAINGPLAASNLTGQVAALNGGTGLTGPTGTNFLRGNGSGAWVSGLLTAGDIPSLGGTYIQNGTTQQATSDFNVSGSGTVGTTMTVGTTLNANTVNSVTQYNINGTRVFATSGTSNLFAGAGAGSASTGSSNAFFGNDAGDSNVAGSSNTILGASADVVGGGLTNATAVGANAAVSQSNSLVLGGVTGTNGGTSVSVGIGTTAPKARLEVAGGDLLIGSPGQGLILKSPDGNTCTRLTIADTTGALVVTPNVPCP